MIESSAPPAALQAVAQRLYDALEAGDVDGITELLTDDFVGCLASGLPGGIGGQHLGADAMIRNGWFAIGRLWGVKAIPDSFAPMADGRLCVSGEYRGRGRRSGIDFAVGFVHLLDFREDRISALTQITDSAAFIEALGDEVPLRTWDLEIADGLAVLRLNRPEVRNAINQAVADEFLIAARRIAKDPGVRAVLLCGAGGDLSVGGDLAYITAASGEGLATVLRSMTTPFHLAFETLASLEIPVVSAVRGVVAGGGLGFVYTGDIVVAAEDARFVPAFGALGLSGDGGGTWHLPRRIGPARAAKAYLLGEPISARDAFDWGMVSEVVASEDVDQRALTIARQLATGPTKALGAMRQLLRQSWDRSLPDQLHAEIQSLQMCAHTQDAPNAISSFIAKTAPTFQGV